MRRSAVLGLALVLLAGACSGGGGSRSASGSSGAARGGTLRVGIERPRSFDPAQASPGSQAELVVADLLFDGLTAMPAGGGAPRPAIASAWQPSPDTRSWTFTLRDGATFADKQPVQASDVKYSLERVAKQGESSLSALRLEVIAGWQELVSGASTELSGVKALNPTTVEIDLTAPFASLPELLSAPEYGIVPRAAVEAAAPAFATAPTGSGPFAFAGVSGDVVTLRRAPGSNAALDAVELHLYDDSDKAYADFAAGLLDWSPVPTAKAADAISQFGATQFRPFHAELFYAFNLADPAFADARFRLAILHAIDRAAVVKAVYPDVADPLNGVVPAGVTGHADDACGATCAHDPAAAKALLQQAFPGGAVPTVHLDYATSPTADAVAGAIESGLTAVGIPVQKRPQSADAYDQFASSGQQGLFEFGWVGLYPDADAYLVPLFQSGSRDNATGFKNADVDAQLTAARAVADPAARAAAFQRAESAVLSQAPVVPLAQLRTKVVVSTRVKGLVLGVGGTFDAESVSLSG